VTDILSEGADRTRVLANFTEEYGAALVAFLDAGAAADLDTAAALGRRARQLDMSMLQLVGGHLEVRRAQVIKRGTERLVDMDQFLSVAMSALDDAGPTASGPPQNRVTLLRGLSDAYLAIASGGTLDERIAEVCVQAQRFFGAADARLVFGREVDDQEPHDPADVMAAPLLGSAALLTVYAPAGRRWNAPERTMLQQLAALISAPINDARRFASAERLRDVGRLLGDAVDPSDVGARVRAVSNQLLGADRVELVELVDGGVVPAELPIDLPADVRVAIVDAARADAPCFLTDRPDAAPTVWAVVPVTTGAARFAVIAAGFDDPQPFDEVQQSFLVEFAGRLASTMERSHAYAREQAARREAELASARWRDLQGLTADLALASTRRRVAQILLRRVLAAGHVESALVAIHDGRAKVEVLAQSGPLRGVQGGKATALVANLAGVALPAGADALNYVAIDRLPRALRDEMAGEGIAAVAGLPIVAGRRDVGMLVLARRRADDEVAIDGELLHTQLAVAGAALQRAARYDSEHAIASTLQRSMLQLPPLGVDALTWGVHYRAGSAGLAGGDWYDLIGLDGHRVAIVVGDVVGRGVEAAAAMGQLRSAVRALARQMESPAQLVGALSEFTTSNASGRYATLAYLVLDTRDGSLDFALAGHLPPLVQDAGGCARPLAGGRGPVLGVSAARTDAAMRLAPGSRLVAYTDGLVERRGETLDIGIARLAAALESCRHGDDPDTLCRTLVDELVPDAVHDDVAVVAVELRPPI
jgi:serine phosphatase RsbU (regulator of sigma subunit)/GAF domain-containing protein